MAFFTRVARKPLRPTAALRFVDRTPWYLAAARYLAVLLTIELSHEGLNSSTPQVVYSAVLHRSRPRWLGGRRPPQYHRAAGPVAHARLQLPALLLSADLVRLDETMVLSGHRSFATVRSELHVRNNVSCSSGATTAAVEAGVGR